MKHERPVEQFLTVFVHLCNLVIQVSSVHFSLAFRSSKLPREWPIMLCLQNSATSLAHSSQFFLLLSPDQFLRPSNYSQFVLSQQWLHCWFQFSGFAAFVLLGPVWEHWAREGRLILAWSSSGEDPISAVVEGCEVTGCIAFPVRNQRKNKPHSLPQGLTWSSRVPLPVDSTTFPNSTNCCSDTLLWKCLPKEFLAELGAKLIISHWDHLRPLTCYPTVCSACICLIKQCNQPTMPWISNVISLYKPKLMNNFNLKLCTLPWP